MSEFVVPNRIYDPEAECMPRDERRKLQAAGLRRTVEQAGKIPFYRSRFEELKVTPESIQSVDDLKRLPFTTKQDLRNAYPFGFFAVPRAELARIHASSGTTGKPTFVGYTRRDLDLWSRLCARFLVAGGLTPDQLVQVSFGYGLFTGGFGLHAGIERVGAAVLPASSGNTQRQILLLEDAGINTLICTPSYALNLAETITAMGKKGKLALRYAHLGGEPWTEEMRAGIEEELGIRAFNNYGLSEIIGPGVSGECAARCGMHIQEDQFIVECLDPKTLEPVAEGEQGELVITSLNKEACPIIRYRTRDLARLDRGKCACGRTTMRMSRIRGRSDDMMIIRGVNVFPSQVESVLLEMPEFEPHYLLIVGRENNTDTMELQVEVRPDFYSDEINRMLALKKKLAGRLQSVLGLGVNVKLVEPRSIERSVGKAKRVIDNRKL